MVTIGVFEAKTHLSELLDRVESGEEIEITRHGRPVARIVSAQHIDQRRVDLAIEKLKTLRTETTLGGISWRELRDEGRR